MGAPVFKTGEAEHLGLAGSIPVRLRHSRARRNATVPTPTPAASPDPRRNIPRMDELLQLPEVETARQRLAEHTIRAIVQRTVAQARRGELPINDIPTEIAQRLG